VPISRPGNGRIAGAAIGLAEPADRNRYGYLSEVHRFGCDEEEIAEEAEDLAAEFLAASLGLHFDENKAWNEKREEWRIAGQIVNTQAYPCVRTHKRKCENTKWLTVLSAAVFLA